MDDLELLIQDKMKRKNIAKQKEAQRILKKTHTNLSTILSKFDSQDIESRARQYTLKKQRAGIRKMR